MLWRSSELSTFTIRATDGLVGTIADLLFDDAVWTLRYAVVDTGSWLPGRKVLLPPAAFGKPDPAGRTFPVDLTRRSIEDSPGIETDAPVSRRMEQDIHTHFGWTPYWGAGYPHPASVPPPGITEPAMPPPEDRSRAQSEGDPNLRSTGEVTGYDISAIDGHIGHVEDFLVEDGSWIIRYLLVDTRNWWPGRKVPVPPDWLQGVDWSAGTVAVGLSRDQIKSGPEYDPLVPFDRAYEQRLFEHFGRTPYWT